MSEGGFSPEESYPSYEVAAGPGPKPETLHPLDFPKKLYHFQHGEVAAHDVMPAVLSERDKEGYAVDVPLVMMGGWGMDIKVMQDCVTSLQKEGKHSVTLEFPGSGEQIKGKKGSSSEINRQAELLYQTIQTLGYEKIDLVGVSYSIETILALSEMHPEVMSKVRHVLPISPPISGSGSFPRLPIRAINEVLIRNKKKSNNSQFAIDEEQNAVNKYATGMFARHLFKDGVVRSWREFMAIMQEKDYSRLYDLQAKISGDIGIIQGEADKLISNKAVWKRVGKGTKSPFVRLPDGQNLYDESVTNRKPPFKVITMREGGHDRASHSSMGRDIAAILKTLNETPEELDARRKAFQEGYLKREQS